MRMTIANNINSTLPSIENQHAKDFLKLVKEKFRSTDKALAGTLMAELTTKKFNGSKTIKGDKSEMWIDGMKEELKSMAQNKVWDLVNLPEGSKRVGCKWVFKTKRDSKGNVERYKVRLVAKELHQMDVKTAFLNGNLEEEVYMKQPEGFFIDGKEKMVCKLKKSIYRLKQASRQWYIKFKDTITSFDFEEIIVDRCIYRKISGRKFIFLVLYVDDILLATNDFGLLHKTKGYLSKNSEMRDIWAWGCRHYKQAAENLFSKNDKYSNGAKHMDIKYFIVKGETQKQRVYLEHISTDLMIDDPLTKGLPPKAFTQYVMRLGLDCIDN
ncbi:retrovirus-related pol polyprotein from transposon TNT 1-94 [Tanacetum coccineum]